MFLDAIKRVYAFLFDTIQTILLTLSVFFIIYIFIMRPFEVSGESMFPTFKNAEYILTNLIGLRLGPPQRGDVIVFQAPVDREKDYIKRIIAVGGDTVGVRDGSVYLNGKKLDESAYLSSDVFTNQGSFLRNNTTIIVPKDEFVVMGDNRPHSSD
jgi:signal peptidase I